jgi:CheY-like chemotaxis protein
MVDLLESMGHTVTEVGDGLAAVQRALSDRPDLIMLDLMMPLASGESALKFLRGTPEIAKIPVVVVSAHSDVRHIATSLGADAWLSKPIEIKQLRATVETMLKKGSHGESQTDDKGSTLPTTA